MNHLDDLYNKSNKAHDFAVGYADYLAECFKNLDFNEVDKFINLLLEKRESGHVVYFIGNGGSAATASHFANDLSIGTRCPEKPFKVMSLTDNNAVMTAIANDFGYDQLFLSQLRVFMKPGDVLVAISASGNSPNIIEAVKWAKQQMGNTVVGLTGFDGGELKEMSDIKIHVDTKKGEYGPVEDIHMFVDHLVGSYINRVVIEEASKAKAFSEEKATDVVT